MRPPLAYALVAASLAAGLGCRTADASLPQACRDATPGQIEAALHHAPAAVALPGGERLSACVIGARADADLQTVGLLYTAAANHLAARLERSDDAALQLGYLLGAVRRGAARTGGLHAELVRRIEQAVGISGVPRARRAAFARGEAAGRRRG